MTFNNKILLVLCLAIAISAGLTLVYLSQQLTSYQLDISNESDLTIHEVKVFGMGVNKAVKVVDIKPNQLASIVVYLKEQGDLRFSIKWGGNSIDQLIVRDVSTISYTQQWITVFPNNHFVINNIDNSE